MLGRWLAGPAVALAADSLAGLVAALGAAALGAAALEAAALEALTWPLCGSRVW